MTRIQSRPVVFKGHEKKPFLIRPRFIHPLAANDNKRLAINMPTDFHKGMFILLLALLFFYGFF